MSRKRKKKNTGSSPTWGFFKKEIVKALVEIAKSLFWIGMGQLLKGG